MGVLANVPFLGGYNEQDQINRAKEASGLQDMGSMLKLSELMRQSQNEQALRGKLSALTPEQQANPDVVRSLYMQHASPHDALAALSKNPTEGLPQIAQLQYLSKNARDKGNIAIADQLDAHIAKLNSTENSAGQEGMNYLLQASKKVRSGIPLTPEEDAKARLLHQQMTTKVSPLTGAVTNIDYGDQFNPFKNFGVGQTNPAGPKSPAWNPSIPVNSKGGGNVVAPMDTERLAVLQSELKLDPNNPTLLAELGNANSGRNYAGLDSRGAPVAIPMVSPSAMPIGIPKVTFTPGPDKNTPLTTAAKANADLKAGRITQDQFDAAVGGVKAYTPSELSAVGAQIATGMPITQVIPGFGAAYAAPRNAGRAEAINQIKAQNPGMSDQQAGEELANRSIDFVAGKKSVGQLTTMLGATRQAVDQLDQNVKKVSEAMDKLGGGGLKDLSPIFTAIARGEQKWTGDPAYSELYFYMHAAAMESARILQGGQSSIAQLHQGAAEEAKKWADANFTTPKAWKEGVAPAMLQEGKMRIETYQNAIQKQRIGGNRLPIPDTSPLAPTSGNLSDQIPGQQSQGNTVTLPTGKVLTFPSGAAAQAFRMEAGIK